VIGALYLDAGMPAVLALVDAFFADALAGVAEGRQGRDCKSLLMEAAHARFKATPRYRVVSETGPEHEKVFEVEVSLNGEPWGRSSGRSKKEAEQAAAEIALAALERQR
jgi:ribonuclease-3